MASKTVALKAGTPAAHEPATISREDLADVDDHMEQAAVLTQLTFWIENARRAIDAVEAFTHSHPETGKKLFDVYGYARPDWTTDQSEGLQCVQNQLLAHYRAVRDIAAQEARHG